MKQLSKSFRMNTKLLKKARSEQEVKEMEEMYNSSIRFREMLTDILEEDKAHLERKALNLLPSFMWKWRYNKLTSEIRAIDSLINLLK